jgi:hypothetical protein
MSDPLGRIEMIATPSAGRAALRRHAGDRRRACSYAVPLRQGGNHAGVRAWPHALSAAAGGWLFWAGWLALTSPRAWRIAARAAQPCPLRLASRVQILSWRRIWLSHHRQDLCQVRQTLSWQPTWPSCHHQAWPPAPLPGRAGPPLPCLDTLLEQQRVSYRRSAGQRWRRDRERCLDAEDRDAMPYRRFWCD